MKVLHILNNLTYSGAELMLYNAEQHFKNAGIKTHILSTGSSEIGAFAEKFKAIGVEVSYIPFRKSPGHFFALRKFLAQQNFDVIHIHKESAFLWTALTSWFPLGNVRIIRTVHYYFEFSGYLKLRRKLHHWIARRILGVRFISIAKDVWDNERKSYNTNSTLINNWTDTTRFSMSKSETTENGIQKQHSFLSVGRCTEIKNHKVLFQLVKLLKDQGLNFQYIHIGTGPLECTEKKLAEQLNISDQVTFVGSTIEVEKFLSKVDYYLMPSLMEGLGVACAEAMSSGKICIVNNVPGLQNLIKSNETGFLVDFNNLDEVSDIIFKVQNDSKLKRMISENARKYIVDNFSFDNINKQIALYA